jgi:CHAT domain-containing protein
VDGERLSSVWLQSADDVLSAQRAGDHSRAKAVLLAPEYEALSPERLVPGLSSRLVEPGFRTLPGASHEIGVVATVLRNKGLEHQAILGREATEEAVRALKGPSVLHLAVHGFRVPPETPLFGGDSDWVTGSSFYWPFAPQGFLEPSFLRVGVALSGANRGGTLQEHDGLLTASEAADLDLRGTSLVVLSGCETAYPTRQDVGGAYDLSLAFRIAGAGSVVGSLWKVDDRATALLMEELYRLLVEGEPVVDALWKAKKKLRQRPEFSHPNFWAAFEVQGNGGAVWAAP